MKFLLDEEIEIFPKIIFWFCKPKELTIDLLVKFLKKDVLFLDIKYNFEDIYKKLNESRKIGIIINLDDLIDIKITSSSKIIDFLNNIITPTVREDETFKIIVHSRIKNAELSEYFDKHNIIFFSNDDIFKRNRIESFIEQILNSVFDLANQRTSLRLGFRNNSYQAQIVFENTVVNGTIKDISLKGAGLVLEYEVDYNNIHIGNFVTLNIDFKVLFFKIQKGIVIRKNQHDNLLGIKIDLDDPYMIDNDNMVILNKIIESWVLKLLSKENIFYLNKD